MEPVPQPIPVATLDDADSPGDVIDVLALANFVAGMQPFARTVDLGRVLADATLAPADGVVVRRARHGG